MQTRLIRDPYLYELAEDTGMSRNEFEGLMSGILLLAYHNGNLETQVSRKRLYDTLKHSRYLSDIPKKNLKEIFEVYLSFVLQKGFRQTMLQNLRYMNPEYKDEYLAIIFKAVPQSVQSDWLQNEFVAQLETEMGSMYGNPSSA
jgi:hypothetical protein